MGPINMGVCPITIQAGGALVPHRFVGVDFAQAGAAENTLGVSGYNAASGEDTTIDTLGVVSVEAGDAVSVGDEIETDASGRAVTQDAGPTVARALDAATEAGELIRCILIPN